MNKKQLQAKFRAAESAAQDFVASIEADGGRAMTTSERAKLAGMMNELEEIERDLERLKAAEAPTPINGRSVQRFRGDGEDIDLGGGDRSGGLADGATSRSFNPEHHRGQRPTADFLWPNQGGDRSGFRDWGEFVEVLRSGRHDPRLSELRATAQSIGIGSEGGLSIPTQFARTVLDEALENEIIRPRAQGYPMGASELKIPAFDGADRSTGQLFGGWKAVWMAEHATNSRQKAKTRQVTLHAYKLALYVGASSEFIADVPGGAAVLGSRMAKAIAYGLDDAFLNGDGAGKPGGILNAPSLVTVLKETGQAADTITYTNLTKMEARLHPALDNGAFWLCNPTVKPQLRKLSVAVGTGGSHIPVMKASGGRMTLLEREVVFSEKVPALGALGDVLLLNPSQYAVGIRSEVSVASTLVASWFEDEVDIRGIVRADGVDTWTAPVTPPNGDTLGWVVALEARA